MRVEVLNTRTISSFILEMGRVPTAVRYPNVVPFTSPPGTVVTFPAPVITLGAQGSTIFFVTTFVESIKVNSSAGQSVTVSD